jgi:hypothetical protein
MKIQRFSITHNILLYTWQTNKQKCDIYGYLIFHIELWFGLVFYGV